MAIRRLDPIFYKLNKKDRNLNRISNRDLCKKYPTFRQRSEIPEVAVEVSLQPWRNYKTDGCILFSDILTPLPGVGCEFTIEEKLGPVMEPIKNWDDFKKVSVLFLIRFKSKCYYVLFI